VPEALLMAVDLWEEFAAKNAEQLVPLRKLELATWNVALGHLNEFGEVDAIVVSPPYANRLDYSSMWAPESEILAALFDKPTAYLKDEQLGSTVVTRRRPSEELVQTLPKGTQLELKTIRSDESKASDSYYYPFFANYALGLQQAIKGWAPSIRLGGRMIIFVRNTVRKDQLFRADELIRETLIESGFAEVRTSQTNQVIRSHIGLLRHRRTKTGVHGLAQLESWLSFERTSR
jgi:hypothetical protein